MDESEKQELREVLVAWYGLQANNWDMTDELLNLVMEMMREMRSCTARSIRYTAARPSQASLLPRWI